MRVAYWIWPLAAAMLLSAARVGAQDALTADEIVRRSRQAFYAAGEDMVARMVMKLVNKAGKERLREMTMLRKNLDEGEQKYFIYFHRPVDVREMTFMVWKHPRTTDDRWLFIPAIKLVRRIAADDSRSSFVGSDFTYEDISGRDVAADNHERDGEEEIDGRPCYIVVSTPTEKKGAEFARKRSWIATETFLPLKEEYYDRKDRLYRVFIAEKVETVDGHPTVTVRVMKNVKKQHRTELEIISVQYDVGLEEGLFSERYLRRPPRKWIK